MKLGDKIRPMEPPIPAGQYLGHIVGVLDLGEQYSDLYKNYSNKLCFTFEVCGQTHEVDGKTVTRDLSKTLSVAAKAGSKCRTFFDGLAGKTHTDEEYKEIDPFSFLGMPVALQIVLSEDQQHNNIMSVTPVPPFVPSIPPRTLPMFRFDTAQWDDKQFEALPEWAKERLKKSTEYQQLHPSTDALQIAPQPVQQFPGFAPVEQESAVIPF